MNDQRNDVIALAVLCFLGGIVVTLTLIHS
jgi:hypothetical protein